MVRFLWSKVMCTGSVHLSWFACFSSLLGVLLVIASNDVGLYRTRW